TQPVPLSAVGPRRQPSATEMRPPPTSKTWPVTGFDSALPSQTTSGATLSGPRRSAPAEGAAAGLPGRAIVAVIRVRAVGEMALAVTPYRPSSRASPIVIAARPAFAAE